MTTLRRRVRLGYVVPPSPTFAGIERVVHEIADGIARVHGDEFDVHVAFARRYLHRDLEGVGYRSQVLRAARLLALPLRVRSWAAEHDLDVVVVPQIEASTLIWFALRGTGVEHVVAHLHGNPRIEQASGSTSTRLAFRLFKTVVAPRLAAVVAVAPALRAYVAQELAPRTPTYYAKNPLRAISDSSRSVGSAAFQFVTVARLARQKGIDVLLDAMARARPDLPACELVLVGEGPDRNALEEQSRRLGLENVVRFVGAVDEPAVFVRNADCFVLPSRWEGFPLVLLEALALGLPVLATRCDFGPADLVDDPRLGELVAPDDAEALAGGLRRATTWRRDAVTEDVRRRAAGRYARPEAVASHVEVLRAITGAPA